MLPHPTPGDMFDDIEFRWLRPRGVQIVEGRFLDGKGMPSAEAFEMIVASQGDYDGGEEYSPIQEAAALSSDFAKLTPEKDQIVAFASKWGFLERPSAARASSQGKQRLTVIGQAIISWVRSVQHYQHASAILKWLKEGDDRELKKRVVWNSELEGWRYTSADGSVTLSFRPKAPSDKRNIFIELGHRAFAAYVNFYLKEHCYPFLLPTVAGEEWRFLPRIGPKNLIGLLWWQLGREALGDVSYHLCKVCKKPLEISKDDTGFRANREFCSSVCRQSDYRAKVKTAKQMKADGWKVEDIAKQLKTTMKVVENWLTKKK